MQLNFLNFACKPFPVLDSIQHVFGKLENFTYHIDWSKRLDEVLNKVNKFVDEVYKFVNIQRKITRKIIFKLTYQFSDYACDTVKLS